MVALDLESFSFFSSSLGGGGGDVAVGERTRGEREEDMRAAGRWRETGARSRCRPRSMKRRRRRSRKRGTCVDFSEARAKRRRWEGSLGFGARAAMRRPREYYAKSIGEEGTRLYEEGDERSRRPGSVGNLVGVFGVLARFATEETLPTVNATEDGMGRSREICGRT